MKKIAIFSSLLIIFTIPWEDSIAIGTLGSITRLIGLLVAGLWFFKVLIYNHLRRPHLYHGALLLFIIWNILSFTWAKQADWTMERIKTYAQIFLLVYIFWDLYETYPHLIAVLQTYIYGAYVAIVATFVNFINGREAYLYSGGRYTMEGVNAVNLTVILSIGLSIAWYLIVEKEGKLFQKIINFVFIPSALFIMLLTGSRTAFFTMVPAFVYGIFTLKKINRSSRFFVLIMLIVSLIGIMKYLPETTLARLSTVFDTVGTGDFGLRMGLWLASLQVLSLHPLFGVGSGNLRLFLGSVAHNSFLSVLAELGPIGLILFCLILIIVIYQIFVQPEKRRNLWIAIFATWAIGAVGLTWEFRKPTWLFLSLIIIGASLIPKETEKNNIPQIR